MPLKRLLARLEFSAMTFKSGHDLSSAGRPAFKQREGRMDHYAIPWPPEKPRVTCRLGIDRREIDIKYIMRSLRCKLWN